MLDLHIIQTKLHQHLNRKMIVMITKKIIKKFQFGKM
ncbi:ORF076 [Staphylococcus phage 85]|uniref:ORF076 n=1 Tax=Staphylococcus phage 85 TaxID=2908111 RepID=Q4ZDC9_9CAUD|nr:ORF076 [Staphylococcus phage 85]